LELVEPAHLRQYIMKPEQYVPPANVGWCFEQGWNIHEVGEALLLLLLLPPPASIAQQ
jgi:hypothetical protein